MTLQQVLLFLIEKGPKRTASQLAEAIYGKSVSYQQLVNSDCNLLLQSGLVERLGDGGHSDPFLYVLSEKSEETS
jgi:hypothetical protein